MRYELEKTKRKHHEKDVIAASHVAVTFAMKTRFCHIFSLKYPMCLINSLSFKGFARVVLKNQNV